MTPTPPNTPPAYRRLTPDPVDVRKESFAKLISNPWPYTFRMRVHRTARRFRQYWTPARTLNLMLGIWFVTLAVFHVTRS